MRFFDTHCHLDFVVFDETRDQILECCQQQGVVRLLIPGVCADDWQKQFTLAEHYSQFGIAVGMHPCFMDRHQPQDLEKLAVFAGRPEVLAIGEIGLDFWRADEDQHAQFELLDQQLSLAKQLGLPVILHSRKSNDQLGSHLRQAGIEQGVVHAFSGSWQQAKVFVDQGLKLGLGGAITYERANKLREVVKKLPLSAMVLETDAPDMPLCGKQGQPNRPDYLPEVFQVLCELRIEDADVLAEQLWQNSVELFAKAPRAN